MGKVAESLTKGVALFVAVAGFMAARDGGAGRLIANGGWATKAALVFAAVSVLVAFGAWIMVATDSIRRRPWYRVTFLSVALIGLSIGSLMVAIDTADRSLERPSLALEQQTMGLKFTATIERLKANQFMRTTVYGYPVGFGGSQRELLFNSTTGPDAKGRSATDGVVTGSLANYEVVEVRAFRGLDDPGCERPKTGILTENTGPAACASIWIRPLREPKR